MSVQEQHIALVGMREIGQRFTRGTGQLIEIVADGEIASAVGDFSFHQEHAAGRHFCGGGPVAFRGIGFPVQLIVHSDPPDQDFAALSGFRGPAGTAVFADVEDSVFASPSAENGVVGIAGDVLSDQTVCRIFLPPGGSGSIAGNHAGIRRNAAVVVIEIKYEPGADGLEIIGATDAAGAFPCLIQRRQQHSRQNRDDRYNDQQLYQSKKPMPSENFPHWD